MGIILTSRYALAAVDGTAATTEFHFVCRGIRCVSARWVWVSWAGVGVPCPGRAWVSRVLGGRGCPGRAYPKGTDARPAPTKSVETHPKRLRLRGGTQ